MAIRGMMDGWTPDDVECQGCCGICEECEERADRKADDDYERYRDEQLNSTD